MFCYGSTNDIMLYIPTFHTAGEPIDVELLMCLFWAHPLPEDAFHALLHMGHGGVFLVSDDEGLTLHPGYISGVCTAQVAVDGGAD